MKILLTLKTLVFNILTLGMWSSAEEVKEKKPPVKTKKLKKTKKAPKTGI